MIKPEAATQVNNTRQVAVKITSEIIRIEITSKEKPACNHIHAGFTEELLQSYCSNRTSCWCRWAGKGLSYSTFNSSSRANLS